MPHQAPDTIEVTAQASSIADIDPAETVGTIHEIGINGVGYMLKDTPEQVETVPTSVVPNLQAPRLATTDTPFSQAVERYSFEVFHDWSVGAGQKWLNREESTSRAFYDSEGVDPFKERNELALLETVSQSLSSTYGSLKVVVVGDDLYALTGDNELTRYDGASDTWQTPFTVTSPGAVTIEDLASDGQYWYAACGDRIVRGTTSDPAATWSTENANTLKWAAGRIVAAVTPTGGSSPTRFTTLAADGSEEVVGGHLELDEGYEIVVGEAVGGHLYFGAFAGDAGQIYAWQLGVDSEGNFHVPFVAWEMPQGLIPTAIAGGAGEVWIRAFRQSGTSSGEVNIYRGVPGSGLTPFLVAELGNVDREGDFVEVDDLLVFSYQDSNGDAALGAVNLPTGGWARWLLAKTAGQISDIVEYRGLEVFTVDGKGVYFQDTDSYETSGWLKTSIVDGASLIDKVVDAVTWKTPPLNATASESVQVELTLDEHGTYTDLGTLATAGAQSATSKPGEKAAGFGFRFTLAGDGTTKTKMHAAQAKFHPFGLRDVVTVIRVKAYDNMTGLNGAPLEDNGKGRGATIMRTMEAFGQSRIKLQDTDWHLTGVSHVYDVVSVRSFREAVYDPSLGEQSIGGWSELTLRRAN